MIPIVTRGEDSMAPILVSSNTIPRDEADARIDHIHQFGPPFDTGIEIAGIAINFELVEELGL